MQAATEQLIAESKLTPYFGESWLVWLRDRAGPHTRSRIVALIVTTDMSNEVYADYLKTTMGRDVVEAPLAIPDRLDESDERKVVASVLDAVLRPHLKKVYKSLDPEVRDEEWAEAYRVLQHARALVFVTEEVLREMDARIGKWLFRKAYSSF